MKIRLNPLFSLLAACAFGLGACGPTASGTEPPASPGARENVNLTVFAAASLTDAFDEIGKAFEALHPGTKVNFSFAGSQILRSQIEQGAAADVFASANQTEMKTLVGEKLVQEGTDRTFLTNQLVVILPPDNPAKITSLQDLAKPGLKLVLAADQVPAGKYALQVLDKLNSTLGADYKDKVLANVVSNETDVKQVVAKVQLGEADAGIVYVSDAVASPQLRKIVIPPDANVIAAYPIAPLAHSANPALASAFCDYVLSADGQAILKMWGFAPPSP